MKNFSITIDGTGREYWISRSVAVLALVYAYDNVGNKYVLAEQRGTGTPDPEYVGKWCLPCGYLEYDETTKEAISRELMEETGIYIKPKNFELIYINDDPTSDKRQNITFRFRTTYHGDLDVLTDKYSESNEIMSLEWIPVNKIDNFEWAFNHENIIKEEKSN